jgi:hypothetical protein
MELVAVTSSQISAIGHDGQSKLRVLFKRGGLYEYNNVSVHEFNDMRFAESVGSFFGKFIKPFKPFVRIEDYATFASEEMQAKPMPEPPSPAAPAMPVEPLPVAAEADPKLQQVSKKSSELATQATAIAVIDAASQERASELLLTVAAMRKEIADTWKPMKDAAFKAHRTICAQESTLDAPLLEAEKVLKQRISSFVAEQRRAALEEEERQRKVLQAEAERLAAQESQRLAIEDAIALEAEGRPEEAEAVLAAPLPIAPIYIAPAPVAPAVAAVKGVSMREVWKFRIVDETKIPREYLTVNESAIRAVVDRTKGKIRIPGIETYADQQVAASRRA